MTGGIIKNLRINLMLFTTIAIKIVVGRGAHLFGRYFECSIGEGFDVLSHHRGNMSENMVGYVKSKLQMKFMA
jgi:hypothetical protein